MGDTKYELAPGSPPGLTVECAISARDQCHAVGQPGAARLAKRTRRRHNKRRGPAAERGFFNAQVADVARAAGVAAGTVYLYFRGKDDLLVSIFDRTMREAFDEARAAVAGVRDPGERLRQFARVHLGRLGRDRNLAIVYQVELRQSVKFMEQFSSTLLRDYLGQIRAAIVDGQQTGIFRSDLNATAVAKMFFAAATPILAYAPMS